jgi:hypothetical protein
MGSVTERAVEFGLDLLHAVAIVAEALMASHDPMTSLVGEVWVFHYTLCPRPVTRGLSRQVSVS